jgi:uncharacterized protein YbaR (Trm112 family)
MLGGESPNEFMESRSNVSIGLPEFVLNFLRCPQSGGQLILASEQCILDLTARARAGRLMNVLGRTISSISSQGLVSENGQWFYMMDDGIPCLLPDQAIRIGDEVGCEASAG